ncbi:MAG TPA: aspartate kinase [Terriglobales bacterium]|jgi:aspartate kinase|nr:aspartate kinase [Terriglobales bacterium]
MNDFSQPGREEPSSRLECVVMKFGGTSVEDSAAIRRACQLVSQRSQLRPVLVVSALAGVTDQLMNVGWAAAEGRLEAARESLQLLRQRHEAVAGGLIDGEEYSALCQQFAVEFTGLENVVSRVAAEKAFTLPSQDCLLGGGEWLSSRLVHAALRSAGVDAAWVDARQCVITDAAHTRATPLWQETHERMEVLVLPLLESDRVPVMGGFVGATQDGIPTTLGRGGSDFSASIVGAGLHARRIEIWTDVDGVMTADPNLCSDARRVARMSFDEAADLAYFGAKVLHPATLAPAMRSNVPVWVLNSRNPECPGTEIVAQSLVGQWEAEGGVKAITSKRGVAIVDVEPVRWFAPELLREVFDVFERHQHGLDLLSASRGSLALLVSSVAGLPAIAEELKGLARVRWENHKALVCLVGEQIRRRPEIASQAFRAIAGIDVRMICQGASERNISFLVDESRAVESVQRLHRSFFSKSDAPVHSASQAMCQAGDAWL